MSHRYRWQRWRCRLGIHEPWKYAICGMYTRCAFCDEWLTLTDRLEHRVAARTSEDVAAVDAAWQRTLERRAS